MLNMKNYGNTVRLTQNIVAADVLLRITDAAKMQVPSGDHYYLTLREGTRKEVVRVNLTEGPILHVSRALDGTSGQSFSTAACLTVEWNPLQLSEFVAGGSGTPNLIAPGTYCLGCSTCIDVDSSGRITAINNAEDC